MSELGWLVVVMACATGLLFVAEWRERRDARKARPLLPPDDAVAPERPTVTLLLSQPNFQLPIIAPPTRRQRARWWVANRLRDAARWLEE